jgi:hypothetical protein
MSTPIQHVELGEDLWTEARDSALTLFKTEEAESMTGLESPSP